MSETMEYLAPGDDLWLLAPELACESPIEILFVHGLVASCRARRLTMDVFDGDAGGRIYPVTEDFAGSRVLYCCPQVTVERLRFDFRLSLFGFTDERITADAGTLVVECDGHDYHERTKEQAARDRARDRRVQQWGWLIFRFTGRELYHDAQGCADQCVALLESRLVDGEFPQ